MSHSKVPPNSLDAERAVLSACLLSAKAIDEVAPILDGEHFYSDAHSLIWEAIRELHQERSPVDVVTVGTKLKAQEKLHRVSAAYLVELVDFTPSVAHVAKHAETVYELWRLRSLIESCHRIANNGYDAGDRVHEFIQEAEAEVFGLAQGRRSGSAITLRSSLTDVFARVEADIREGASPRWLMTGLVDLDRIIGPLKPGQLTTIGALSGVGKTSLAMNIAINAARTQTGSKVAALIFSMEMTHDELSQRSLFGEAQVDAAKMYRKEALDIEDWRKLTKVAKELALDNVVIDDTPGLSPIELRSRVRRLVAEYRNRNYDRILVLVDYLQLMNGRAGLTKNASREQEVAAISHALKGLAKECSVHVVALAQLNKESLTRDDKRPRVSDMRESQAIVQDSDKIILIHNQAALDRANSTGTEAPEAESAELIVAKNRGGRMGRAEVMFFPHLTLFANKEHYYGYQ